MGLVRVYNKNQFDHSEKFRGALVEIKAGEFVDMEREDAVLFKSAFKQPMYDKGGVQTMESYKMITIEPIPNQKPEAKGPTEYPCMACDFVAQSKSGLKSHSRAKHQDIMIDEDDAQD
jgi:hypothetical protein